MNYIGSKYSLLDFIDESISKVISQDNDIKKFCDLFAGTGVVGRFFKKKGYHIISNDLQYYSYVLNRHYIGNHKYLPFTGLFETITGLSEINISERHIYVCKYLQNIKPIKGFIYNNFCKGDISDGEYRLYFSNDNGAKCDAIRTCIEKWKTDKLLSESEYYFLLCSLLESIDKVANTASVYGAYLKNLKRSATKDFILNPSYFIINDNEHDIYCQDANNLIENIEVDILYLDPPYNSRQYAANYHVLETISKYDNPKLKGKTGMRDYENQKSSYSKKKDVIRVFSDLIQKAKAKYIFLSYNNEGLMSFDEIRSIMSSRGEYGYFYKTYNRFKSDKDENRVIKAKETIEYVHFVKVNI